MTGSTVFRCAVAKALACCLLSSALAAETSGWPPRDPAEPTAPSAITTAFAGRLRDLGNFPALQKAVGAKGKLSHFENGGEAPHAVYEWGGEGGRGKMRAFVYPSGDFGILVDPADAKGEIQLNNFGAYVCPQCSPSVSACGRRPSWVSHAVHWDASDCTCTIVAPQTLRAGGC